MPAAVITARTGAAGDDARALGGRLEQHACPSRSWPVTVCGIVAPFSVIGTRTTFFLAASTPFLMAEETSRALPMP